MASLVGVQPLARGGLGLRLRATASSPRRCSRSPIRTPRWPSSTASSSAGARIVHIRPAPVPGDARHLSLARRPARTIPSGPDSPRRRSRSRSTWATAATTRSPRCGAGPPKFEAFGKTNVLSQFLVSDRAIHDTMASMVIDGVFDRHPTLRVASIENGSDWVALLVKRLKKQANQTPWVFKEDPLEQIRAERVGHAVLRGGPPRAGRSHRRRAHPVRLRLAARRGTGRADRLRQGARTPSTTPRCARSCATTRSNCSAWSASDRDTSSTRRPATSCAPRCSPGSTSTGTPSCSVDDWWRLVAKAGWTAPHLTPEQGGRGLHRTACELVRAAFAEFGALRPPGGLGLLMAAPTILTHGTAGPDRAPRAADPRRADQLVSAVQRARGRAPTSPG